jgi:hypothetical protein
MYECTKVQYVRHLFLFGFIRQVTPILSLNSHMIPTQLGSVLRPRIHNCGATKHGEGQGPCLVGLAHCAEF